MWTVGLGRFATIRLRASIALLFCIGTTGCSVLVSPDSDRLGARVDGGVNPSGCVPSDCEDGLACTQDQCVDDRCEHVAVDTLCEAEQRCDAVAGCVASTCERDEDCDNGDACDGVETCMGSKCIAGEPLDCDDGLACTVDRCVNGVCEQMPDDDACAYEDLCVVGVCGEHAEADQRGCRPVSKMCDDGDGCTVDVCNPESGACESAKIDNDNDGVAAVSDVCQSGDCDDNNPSIYPGGDEFCNGRDDNCNGRSDESCTRIPNTCSDVATIEVEVGQTRTIELEIGQFTNSYATSCHGGSKPNGADAVLRVRVDGEVDVVVDTTDSEIDTIIATSVSNCSNNAFFGSVCDDDSPGNNPRGSRIWRQRTGDFFLLLDSIEGAHGKVVARISVSAPKPNLCGDSLDISQGGTWIGRARDQGFYVGPCESAGAGREGVARFTSSAGGRATFEGLAFSNGFIDHAMYIYEFRNQDCNIAIACDGYEPLLLEPNLKANQPYVLFVDGANAGAAFAVKYSPP